MTAHEVPFRARYALLRDIDSPELYPLGAIIELPDGRAKLHTYARPPAALGLRQDFPSFDDALRTWERGALICALGTEGEAE